MMRRIVTGGVLSVLMLSGVAVAQAAPMEGTNTHNPALQACRTTYVASRKAAVQSHMTAVQTANTNFAAARKTALDTLHTALTNAGTDRVARLAARQAYWDAITTARTNRLNALKDARTAELSAFQDALTALQACRKAALQQ